MSIPINPGKFPIVDTDFGTTVATALWLRAAQMIEYINASYPLGMLVFVEITQAGLPSPPDPRYWKFMDGTPVSNSNSIFNGVTFPDLRGMYFRHPASGETVLSVGGVNTIDLSHNHSGFTEYANDSGAQDTDDDDNNRAQPGIHRHTIFPETLTYITSPFAHQVQIYIRIA